MKREVRRAALSDVDAVRALRIEALTDAPEAFGSTLKRELARTPSDWQRWFSPGTVFFLLVDEVPRGMACGVPDKVEPEVGHLLAMWVHLNFRGAGAANELVATLKQWALDSGKRELRLQVAERNARARRCYERAGFQLTGKSGFLESTGEPDVQMACKIFPLDAV
jgi:ribosomal protein S18 acetylase RimI-like enzyme